MFKLAGNALRNALVERYDQLFEEAAALFQQFRKSTNVRVAMASRELFVQRVVKAETVASIPNQLDAFEFAEFVLPKIVAEATEADLMRHITTFVESIGAAGPAQPDRPDER